MIFLLATVQLVPDGTLFIHIALILMMIWILNRTFFRPINKIIQSREANKGGRFTEAESIMREVGVKRNSYNESMREIRTEGYEMIEKERTEANSAREKAVAEVKGETAQKLAAEKTEIERQSAEARASIAAEAGKMADQISASILRA